MLNCSQNLGKQLRNICVELNKDLLLSSVRNCVCILFLVSTEISSFMGLGAHVLNKLLGAIY